MSCLLVDVTKDPIFKNTQIKYSFFPFIDKTDPKAVKKRIEEQKERRIERLRIKLSKKSEYELVEIINSDNKYTQEAINVAKELIKK